MKKLLLIPLLIAMVLFAGCTSTDNAQPVNTSVPEITQTVAPEIVVPTAVPEIVAPVIEPVIVPDTPQPVATPVPEITVVIVSVVVPDVPQPIDTPSPETTPEIPVVPTTLQA
jgi:PBP1b-binding outer membrane lipoprotein LpoB